MSAVAKVKLTEAEYLALEHTNDFKSEFYNGEMFAMAGATWNHNRIKSNLEGELYGKFKGGKCRSVSSDQRIKVDATGLYTYPDIAIVCEEPPFSKLDRDALLNPKVIIEVLSPTTENYDRVEKFDHYQRLLSLQEYVLVAQNRMVIERYGKNAVGEWVFRTFTSADEAFQFASIPVGISMTDIYAGVEFPELPQKPQIFGKGNADLAP